MADDNDQGQTSDDVDFGDMSNVLRQEYGSDISRGQRDRELSELSLGYNRLLRYATLKEQYDSRDTSQENVDTTDLDSRLDVREAQRTRLHTLFNDVRSAFVDESSAANQEAWTTFKTGLESLHDQENSFDEKLESAEAIAKEYLLAVGANK